ncbi:MAG: metallophosphoesterase [Candidatus Omnitrophica bacterium]|nr:metallophosphoesterase [Candidatus Omnitrophota bacterium]
MTARTIIFGDIHACYQEWQDLLEKLKVTAEDRLISVGDLVCKGPSTLRTLEIAKEMKNLRCILGNHEVHLLNLWKKRDIGRPVKDYQKEAIKELGDDFNLYMQWIETWPYYLDLEECLVVHAGIIPGIPLKKQDPKNLVTLRTLSDNQPWYIPYKDQKLIVHGHWAAQGLVVRKNVIGLDSGCVYGKELSAVVLPERKIVSVPARKAYCPIS